MLHLFLFLRKWSQSRQHLDKIVNICVGAAAYELIRIGFFYTVICRCLVSCAAAAFDPVEELIVELFFAAHRDALTASSRILLVALFDTLHAEPFGKIEEYDVIGLIKATLLQERLIIAVYYP